MVVAGAVLMVPGYLVLRAADADASTVDLLLRWRTVAVVVRSIGLATAVTAVAVALGVPLAWLTVRTDLPRRRTWAVLAALPLVVPSYIGAYLFVAALGPRGLVQGWLQNLAGVERLPDIRGFGGATLVLALYTYPYVFVMAQAALQRSDPAVAEASRLLGASRWQTFLRVTVPQLQSAVAAGGLLVALYTLRDFGAVSIMRVDTLTRVIYVQYTAAFDRASASALALTLVAVALVVVGGEMRVERGSPRYSVGPGLRRPPQTVLLGRWRWPAVAFAAAVVFLALVLPAGVLAYWLARGLQAGEGVPGLVGPTISSGLASALGAVVTVLAALPVAWLSVRRPSPLSRGIERITYVGFALPGIVVALALVFFGRRVGGPLYGSLVWLVVAYAILFLPQAVGAIRAALLQVRPVIEEAGRTLGQRPLGVLTTVTLPVVWPGLAAGLSLVFLTAMKELPATLVLSPLEFNTLAMQVWFAVDESFFARAAAPALVLILLSSGPMALLARRSAVAAS